MQVKLRRLLVVLACLACLSVSLWGDPSTPDAAPITGGLETPGLIPAPRVPVNPVGPRVAGEQNISSWWNKTYKYRVQLKIEEQDILDRDEPVTVYLTFAPGHHRLNSTRVVKYWGAGNPWTEVPCQVWNTTLGGTSIYIHKATITFIASAVLQNSTTKYFIYYTDQPVENKTAEYLSSSQLEHTFTGQALTVQNGQFEVALNNFSGYHTLERASTNFHTNWSLAPSARRSQVPGNLLYWGCNEGQGTTLSDDSLYENEGSLMGSVLPDWVGGKTSYGQALHFEQSVKQWAVCSNFDEFPSTEISVCLWVRSSDVTHAGTPFSYAVPSQANHFLIHDYNNIRIFIQGVFVITGVSFADGAWHHLGVTWRSATGEIVLYRDGDVAWSGTFKKNATLTAGGTIVLGQDQDSLGGGFDLTQAFRGDMDEIYVFDSALDEARVETIMDSGQRSRIDTIENLISGPVFTSFDITWASVCDMRAWDHCTIYNDLNLIKIERMFWWEGWHSFAQGNASFGILNTEYQGTYFDPTYSEYHFSAGHLTGLESAPFVAQNYSLVRASSVEKLYTSLGVFITQGVPGREELQFSWATWLNTYKASNGKIDFAPGNETDLDNCFAGHTSGDRYTLNFTIWECLADGSDDSTLKTSGTAAQAGTLFASLFDALKHPLIVDIGDEEELFYTIQVHLEDVDSYDCNGVTLSLWNATNAQGLGFVSAPSLPSFSVSPLVTNEQGNATFQYLPRGNYSINITYANPGAPVAPVSLGIVNVTLNSSTVDWQGRIFLVTGDLPLTRVHLTVFRRDSEPLEEITGAVVQFYENQSASQFEDLVYLGNESTDEYGLVTFRWKALDTTLANLTLHIYFLDSPRLINITDVPVAQLTEFVTVPFESEQSNSLSLKIEPFTTELQYTEQTPSVIIGQAASFTAYYGYEVGGTSEGIGGAQLDYVVRDSFNTPLIAGTLGTTGAGGTLGFVMDTNNPVFHAGEVYTLEVTATKSSFTTETESTTFSLLSLPTTLTPNATAVTAYWRENVTVSLKYENSLNGQGIPAAPVTYSVLQSPDVSGSCAPHPQLGPGWYQLEVNTTSFRYIGSYTIQVSASKTDHAPQTVQVALTLQEYFTWINGSTLDVKEVALYWGTETIFKFNYSQQVGEGPSAVSRVVPSAKTASYEWELSGNPMRNGSGALNYNALTGLYELDFNTASRSIGTYLIITRIQESNYVGRTSLLAMNILPRPIRGILNGQLAGNKLEIYQGDQALLNVTAVDNCTGNLIPGCTVSLFVNVGGTTPIRIPLLDPDNDGYFTGSFDSARVASSQALQAFTGSVVITAPNYANISSSLTVEVSSRPVTLSWGDTVSNGRMVLRKGETGVVSVSLLDNLTGTPLRNASVGLVFYLERGVPVTLNLTDENGDGVYSAELGTAPIDTFFGERVLTGNLTIIAENYAPASYPIHVSVGMTEIVYGSGIPALYVVIIGLVSGAGIASPFAYRKIKWLRLPRVMRNLILTRKALKQAEKPPTERPELFHHQQLAKEYGGPWRALDLDPPFEAPSSDLKAFTRTYNQVTHKNMLVSEMEGFVNNLSIFSRDQVGKILQRAGVPSEQVSDLIEQIENYTKTKSHRG